MKIYLSVKDYFPSDQRVVVLGLNDGSSNCHINLYKIKIFNTYLLPYPKYAIQISSDKNYMILK
jgi:hypothetical protein